MLWDRRTLHPQCTKKLIEDIGGITPLILHATQIDVELAVRKVRSQLVGNMDCQRALADSSLARDHGDDDCGVLVDRGISKQVEHVAQDLVTACEVADVWRQLHLRRRLDRRGNPFGARIRGNGDVVSPDIAVGVDVAADQVLGLIVGITDRHRSRAVHLGQRQVGPLDLSDEAFELLCEGPVALDDLRQDRLGRLLTVLIGRLLLEPL